MEIKRDLYLKKLIASKHNGMIKNIFLTIITGLFIGCNQQQEPIEYTLIPQPVGT